MTQPRAKLTVQGRLLLVERVLQGGWTVPWRLRPTGVRRPRVTNGSAGSQQKGGGAARSLLPAAPEPCPLEPGARAGDPGSREATLEGPPSPGRSGEVPSTVHRVLRRRGASRLRDLDRPTRTVVRYERDRPGEARARRHQEAGQDPGRWWLAGRGRDHLTRSRRHERLGYDFVHAAVDDRSHLAYAEIMPDERKETASGYIARALGFIAGRGVTVERVLTETARANGPGTSPLRWLPTSVAHRFTRPYRPQTKGKVERSNLTLKWEWAHARPYDSNDSRTAELER